MLDIHRRCADETGYKATKFLGMVSETARIALLPCETRPPSDTGGPFPESLALAQAVYSEARLEKPRRE